METCNHRWSDIPRRISPQKYRPRTIPWDASWAPRPMGCLFVYNVHDMTWRRLVSTVTPGLATVTVEHASVQPCHNTRSSMVILARPPIPAPLWKSQIALFSMLHLVYGTNSPLIFASLVRHSLFHFLLSHMAVHHLHYLHYHHFYLLLLVQSFILNLRFGSSANPLLHRHFLS